MTAPENEIPRHFKILINGQSVDPKQLPLQRAAAYGEEVRDFIEDIVFEDGQRIHLLGNASPLYDEQGRIRGSVAAFTDLTRLEQAEAERRLIEARFRIVFESQLMPLALWRSDGKIMDANEAFLELFEFSAEELHTGQASWFDVTLPEELPRDLEAIGNLRSGKPVISYEKTLARRNGDRIPILVGFSLLPGSQDEGVVFVLDLTERKRAEQTLRDYARRLEQSNQDLQDFAFIASHDMQEPLRKVRTFSERIKNRYQSQLGAEGTDYIDRLFSATLRMQQMINDLLSYSRILTQPQPYEQVDLNQVLQEVLEDLDEQLRMADGEVVVGELPVIEATAGQMVQLFLNLVNNAVKFHREGVPPRVAITCQAVSPGWIEIKVADNGIGFDELYKERIFRPFERLHGRSEYEGSGIGLSICRRITERHSGSITAHSKPGEGSTFFVRLPVSQP